VTQEEGQWVTEGKTNNIKESLGDSSPLCSRDISKEYTFTSQNTTSIMDIYFI